MDDVLVICSKKRIKKIRDALEAAGYYDNSRRIANLSGGDSSFGLPITSAATEELSAHLRRNSTLPEPFGDDCILSRAPLPKSKKEVAALSSEHRLLRNTIISFLAERGFRTEEREQLLLELPKSWEKHGDLLLLPGDSFAGPLWRDFGEPLWTAVARVLRCSRVAVGGRVSRDKFRSAAVWLALGRDGWVEHVDNGIKYIFDVTNCMFSSGNITEKIRIAKLDCSGETVLDMYAGIGYFTLPYLVHARARLVHACEWNAHAVEALRRGLAANRVQDRCVLHFGDNKQVAPKGVADRVNLGLLPSSEAGWLAACAALRPDSGGWLHVHGNVCSKPGSETAEHNPWETGSEELRDRKSGILEGQETSSSVFRLGSGVVSKVDSFDSGLETKDSTTSLKPSQPDMSSPAEKVSLTDKQDCPDLDSKGSGKHPQRCREVWEQWAAYVAGRVRQLLAVENPLREGKLWRVVVRHIEHVKSYAPHVEHVVVDVDCRPMPKQPAGETND